MPQGYGYLMITTPPLEPQYYIIYTLKETIQLANNKIRNKDRMYNIPKDKVLTLLLRRDKLEWKNVNACFIQLVKEESVSRSYFVPPNNRRFSSQNKTAWPGHSTRMILI